MTDPRTEFAYEHNGTPVDRAAFYAIACDPRRSVAVEACAGAGKTWMLVSRILRALLDGAQPQEVLAITFTKKAAGEMRQRLQEWLAEFAQAPSDRLHAELVQRGVPQASVAALAPILSRLYLTVLKTGRPVQVRTFHSWFAALLRAAPVAMLQRLGLPVHYQLLEDDSEAVKAVWPRFLAVAAQDPEARADYLAAVAAHGRSQTHKALITALAKRVEFALADAHQVVARSVLRFQDTHPAFAGMDTPLQALDGASARSRWLAWASALGVEANQTPRRAAQAVVQAFETSDLATRFALLRKAFFVANEDRLTNHLLRYAAAQQAEPELQALGAALAQHAAWAHHQRLMRLTRRLVAEYAQLKRERGWVDMNDLETASLEMLRDDMLSGWVQERLDARVKHLLIDEFQDTNPLQWQALKAWLSAYAGAGGGLSVFIVGDPKQSIYRFRRAEPQVFQAAQDFVRLGLRGDLLSCDHTRRNAQSVIGLVNGVMGAAHQSGEYPGYRAHTTESCQAGQVVCLPPIARAESSGAGPDRLTAGLVWRDSLTTPRESPEETLRSREATQVARYIADAIDRGLRPGEIMVLARKREPLGVLRDALRALHIPSQQAEKSDLADIAEVQDLVALLDVLVSPTHDLSLARVLKSPLFGLGDDALVELAVRQRAAQADGQTPSWLALLTDAAADAPPLTDLGGRPLGEVLARWRAWVHTLPPHDALDAICHDGDVFARYAASAPAALRDTVLAHLRALLAAALNTQGGRFLTPYAWVRALKSGGTRSPALASTDAVRLLTVHGAKGLEAELVLLIDTDAAPPVAETMGVLVDWPGAEDLPRRFSFIASESRPPVCNAEALALEHLARQREELNTLYVAMTRARDTVVVSSIEPHRVDPGSWWRRLSAWGSAHPGAMATRPADGDTDRPTEKTAQNAAPTDLEPFLMLCLPPAPVVIDGGAPESRANAAQVDVTDNALDDALDAAASDPFARLGQAVHRLLEWGGLALGAAGTAQRLSLAREFDLTHTEAERATELAQRIQNGEGAWAWQAELLDWEGNEVELHHQGAVLRLDRLVRRRDTGVWWVLDHKTAARPERQPRLVAQLQRYANAVRAAYPGAEVQAAFLTSDGRLVVA